uniref:Glycerophosphodiester phosphodiesterase 1 n=1 Tax=Erpetoichthys calabaricus TaxID=27687 RepID=A0A8C4XEL4_ERPCA
MVPAADGLGFFSLVFLAALLITRGPMCSTLLTASLYIFLCLFRYPPVPASRAKQVLRPAGKQVGSRGVSVIAHRGGAHDAPENTLAAIRKANENGATGVELDVEFTADGVSVLMHDDTVDRTTNGTGHLSQMSYSDLLKLDAAAKHRLGDSFHGEKVPTLQDAILECLKHHLIIYFDVKGHADEAVAALKMMYEKYPVLYNTSIVCSFEPKIIYKMRQADSMVVTALTHRPWSLSHWGDGTPHILLDWSHHNILWNFCGVSAFLMQKNFISQDYVRFWAARDVEVVSWTVLGINYITDSLLEDCDPHY